MSSVHVLAQCRPHVERSLALAGQVTEQGGLPLAGAVVKLHQRNGIDQTRSTDPHGRFDFGEVCREAGSLDVQVPGRGSVTEVFKPALVTALRLRIVLPSRSAVRRPPVQQETEQHLEFADAPDFKVAGITDWTAVGGHGSDVTLRTSEDLARKTSVSNHPGLDERPDTPEGLDPAQEKKLRADLALAPRSYALNHELGELYLRAHHYAEAAPFLKTASDANSNAAEDEYAVAQACAGAGDLHEALHHLTVAMAKEENAEFLRFAGDLEERLGDPVGAVREEQRAAQLDPSEANYLAWASELLLHRAIWQAADVLAKGSQFNPRSSRILAEWGAALFAEAHYDQAAQRLCQASELEPKRRESYLLLGKAALGSPAPLPCAGEALARFVRLQPEDAEAWYYDAMELLKSQKETDPRPIEDLLRRAVALNPRYADAYLQLGILAAAGRRNDEAMHDLEQAIAADPQQAEAHYRLGVLYERSGKSREAEREFHAHEALVKQQADAVESERRKVTQFLVMPQSDTAETHPQ